MDQSPLNNVIVMELVDVLRIWGNPAKCKASLIASFGELNEMHPPNRAPGLVFSALFSDLGNARTERWEQSSYWISLPPSGF